MSTIEKNVKTVDGLLETFNINSKDRESFWKIAYPIFEHDEFQRRMNSEEFPHHDKVSLGDHILSDAIVTYQLAKKKGFDKDTRDRSVRIALFHDLYELPWQNANIVNSRFTNIHGFTHPLEGIVNAVTWYPEYFENKRDAEIITDGVVHHMFPFPVRSLDGSNAELNNQEKFERLEPRIKNLIINSSMRFHMGTISLCPSKFKEGRIMSNADKIVSFGKDLKTVNGLLACVTGHNDNIEDKTYTYKKTK